jgi:hypothetical protein
MGWQAVCSVATVIQQLWRWLSAICKEGRHVLVSVLLPVTQLYHRIGGMKGGCCAVPDAVTPAG